MHTPQRAFRIVLSAAALVASVGLPAVADAAVIPSTATSTTTVDALAAQPATRTPSLQRLRATATDTTATSGTAALAPLTASAVTTNRTQADLPITATFGLTGRAGTSIRNVTVSVTSSTGSRTDFPTVASATLPTSGTYRYQGSRYLSPGTYTIAATYTDAAGATRSLSSRTLTVWGVPGKHVTFPSMAGRTSYPTTNQFATSDWVAGHTSAFPGPASGTASQTNAGDAKLDCINPAWSAPDADGTFRATRVTADQAASCGGRSDLWANDLITTRHSDLSGFQMRAGDSITATVTLTDTQGAWPSLWTWTDTGTSYAPVGHGEVDFFENHDDTGQTLEYTTWATSQRPNYCYQHAGYTSGKPFQLRIDVRTTGVDYYVDGALQCTLPGVAPDWAAHLVVSLDVADGAWHRAPGATQTAMAPFKVTDLTVWR